MVQRASLQICWHFHSDDEGEPEDEDEDEEQVCENDQDDEENNFICYSDDDVIVGENGRTGEEDSPERLRIPVCSPGFMLSSSIFKDVFLHLM